MVMPYLHFNGNCEEAFNFYAKCFEGSAVHISRMHNDPNNNVMHAELRLAEGGGIAGSDWKYSDEKAGIQILVLLPSRERAEKVISLLSEGGTVVKAFAPHPPPDDGGGGSEVLDKYGYTWFICA
ncbi:MAG: VOC family protein [Defluviitaleaceae bacterium]|nr:VOC family protein [Defluviitaleaceae bacterium]